MEACLSLLLVLSYITQHYHQNHYETRRKEQALAARVLNPNDPSVNSLTFLHLHQRETECDRTQELTQCISIYKDKNKADNYCSLVRSGWRMLILTSGFFPGLKSLRPFLALIVAGRRPRSSNVCVLRVTRVCLLPSCVLDWKTVWWTGIISV